MNSTKKKCFIISGSSIFISVLYVFLFCEKDLTKQNAYSFMINTIVIPIVILFISMLIIGLISKNSKQISFFAIFTTVIYTLLVNLVLLLYMNESVMNNIIKNTRISEGTLMSFNSEVSLSGIISSIFMNLIVAVIGGFLGMVIGKKIFIGKKPNSKFEGE